jgi:hypothetical protein
MYRRAAVHRAGSRAWRRIVDEQIVLTRVIQGELPFTLNLPDGTYPVQIDGAAYPVGIRQNLLAVADGPDELQFGTEADLRPHFGDRWAASFKHELRTVVSNLRQVKIPRANLPVPTDDTLIASAMFHLMYGDPREGARRPDQVELDARQWLDGLEAGAREAFIADTRVRMAASELYQPKEVVYFVGAINTLIRLYMARFGDQFVQEVTEDMFSSTTARCLNITLYHNDRPFQVMRCFAGMGPYISPRPWRRHPEADITDFRTKLQTFPDPDPVALLHVRARSMLLRGAYRSAMLEASAAFDLCLLRKIRNGLAAKGKTDMEIEQLLEEKERYEDRAKSLLKQATGKSAPEVNNARWERFRQDRKKRGAIAHSANELDAAYATGAVENMIELTEEIDRIPV